MLVSKLGVFKADLTLVTNENNMASDSAHKAKGLTLSWQFGSFSFYFFHEGKQKHQAKNVIANDMIARKYIFKTKNRFNYLIIRIVSSREKRLETKERIVKKIKKIELSKRKTLLDLDAMV